MGQGCWQYRVLSSVCSLPNRLSVTNMEDLKRRLLRVIANSNKPKVTTPPGLAVQEGHAEAGRWSGTATASGPSTFYALCLHHLPCQQTSAQDSMCDAESQLGHTAAAGPLLPLLPGLRESLTNTDSQMALGERCLLPN